MPAMDWAFKLGSKSYRNLIYELAICFGRLMICPDFPHWFNVCFVDNPDSPVLLADRLKRTFVQAMTRAPTYALN